MAMVTQTTQAVDVAGLLADAEGLKNKPDATVEEYRLAISKCNEALRAPNATTLQRDDAKVIMADAHWNLTINHYDKEEGGNYQLAYRNYLAAKKLYAELGKENDAKDCADAIDAISSYLKYGAEPGVKNAPVPEASAAENKLLGHAYGMADEINSKFAFLTLTKERIDKNVSATVDYMVRRGWLEQEFDWKATEMSANERKLFDAYFTMLCGRNSKETNKDFNKLPKAEDGQDRKVAVKNALLALDSMRKDSFWQRNFQKIVGDKAQVEDEEAMKRPGEVELPEDVAETPGALDAYTDVNVYQQDWRVKLVLDGSAMALEKNDEGLYSVQEAEGAFVKEAGESTVKVPVSRETLAICSRITKITGTLDDDGKLVGSITDKSALGRLAELGIVVERDARKKVKENGGETGTVKKIGSSFYALDKGIADKAGVSNLHFDRKAIVAALGKGQEGVLDDEGVQRLIMHELKADLLKLGAISEAKGKRATIIFENEQNNEAMLNYFNGKEKLGQAADLFAFIAGENAKPARVPKLDSVAALIALDPAVAEGGWAASGIYQAILAKCDTDKNGKIDTEAENSLFDGLVASLKEEDGSYRAGLRSEDGTLNLDRQKVLSAINGYNAATGQQEKTASQLETTITEDVAVTATAFGDVDLTRAVALPQWLVTLGNETAVRAALEGVGAERLTSHLEGLVLDDKLAKGRLGAAQLAAGIAGLKESEQAGWGESALPVSMSRLSGFITKNRQEINAALLKGKLGDTQIDQAATDAIMREFVNWASTTTDSRIIEILAGISEVGDLANKAINHYEISQL